jgi:hypothetical protein
MPIEAEPKLTVQLKLDGSGNPIFVQGPEHRRYDVILEVENVPPDAYAATFEFDPSTTYDAFHTLRPKPDGGFHLETTTYGDSPVVVRLRRSKGGDLLLMEGIARGLRRTHATAGDLAPFREALSYIAEH